MAGDLWFIDLTVRTLIAAFCALVVSHAVIGAAIASYGRIRPGWGVLIGVVGGPLGLMVLLVAAAVRSSDLPASTPRALRLGESAPLRIGRLAALAVFAAVPVAGFFIPVLVVRGDWFPTIWITASTPLDLASAVIVIGIIVVSALLSRRRASRWSAGLMASVAGTWLFVGGFAVAFEGVWRTISEYFVSLDLTLDQLLGSLGGWINGDDVVLPPEFDTGYLSFFGIENGRIPLDSLNLDQPLASVGISFGPLVWIYAVAGALALVWSILELRTAHLTGLREQASLEQASREQAFSEQARLGALPEHPAR